MVANGHSPTDGREPSSSPLPARTPTTVSLPPHPSAAAASGIMPPSSTTTTPCRQHSMDSDVPHEQNHKTPAEQQSSSDGSNDNVRVAVRVRPLNAREKAASADARFSWAVTSESITQSVNGKKVASNNYTFDNVFQPPAGNLQIFQTVAKPVITSAVEGINGVIFAYGQTAAGKTHTMLGNEIDPGVTPRSIQAVFDAIANSPNRQFLLRATYIEIYNEIIRDLLFPANDNLKIHEDAINKRVFVDAREEIVTSVENVMAIIAAGEHVRAVGETNMNDRSSRSHTIFSLKIESREMTAADARQRRQTQALQNGEPIPEDDDDDDEDDSANEGVAVRASSLSLVDLAGSERASFTKAQGMRLVEGGHINKSLLTLGNVINKLSSGEMKSKSLAHIPYRDSKLTRLLQPALGGNARTAIICAVTSAILHMDETISTLKFASRAKKVTNSAKTNEFLDDRAKLRRAEKVIMELKNRLDAMAMGKGGEYFQTPKRLSYSTGADGGSPSGRQSISPATRAKLEKRGEKRFERLLDTIAKHEGKRASSSSMDISRGTVAFSPRKKRRVTSTLHLMYGPSARRLSDNRPLSKYESSTLEGGSEEANAEVEKEMAELRKRAFNAEKEKRILMSEIRYEREASQREVAHLFAVGEEANRQRNMAEQECNDIHIELSREMGRSFVDEIFSNAVNLSGAKRELRTADSKLEQMKVVQMENKEQKQKVLDLNKKLVEYSRREKRGIGPVLRDCKTAQKKQADTESKLRSVKQQASQASADKARLEREVKSKDRQIKILNNRVDQQSRKDESRFEMRLQKEVNVVKKKADEEIHKLKQANQKQLQRAEEQKLENQAALDSLKTKLETQLEEIKLALETEKTTCVQLKEQLEKAEQVGLERQQLIDSMEIASSEMGKRLKEELEMVEEVTKDKQGVEEEFEQMKKMKKTVDDEIQRLKSLTEKQLEKEEELKLEHEKSLVSLKAKLEAQLVEVVLELESGKTKWAELQVQLDKAEQVGRDKQDLVVSMKEASNEMEKRLKEEEQKAEELKHEKRILEEEVEHLKKVRKEGEEEIQKLISVNQKQVEKGEELKLDNQMSMDTLKAKLEIQLEGVESALQTEKQRCAELQEQLDKAEQVGRDKQELVGTMEETSNEMSERLKAELKKVKEIRQDKQGLEEEVEDMKNMLRAANKTVDDEKATCARLQKQLKKANETARDKQQLDKQEAEAQLKDMRAALDAQNTRCSELLEQLKKAEQRGLDSQEQVNSKEIASTEMGKRLRDELKKVEEISQERQRLEEESEDLKNMLRAANKAMDAEKAKCGRWQKELEKAKRIAREKHQLGDSLKSKMEEEVGKSQTALGKEKEQAVHWMGQLKNALRKVAEKERELHDLEMRMSKMTGIGGEHCEIKKRLLWRDSKIAKLEKHNDRLRNSLTAKHPTLVDRDLRRLQEVEMHNHMLQSEKDSLVGKVTKLENIQAQLKSELLRLRELIKNIEISRVERSIEYRKGILLEQNPNVNT